MGYTTPHITIVPDKQAEYVRGKDALLSYLKENSLDETTMAEEGKLKPGKIRFTVTRDGKIDDVELISTSGYPRIDKTMIELIINMPGKWHPAENVNGGNEAEKLIFSFGITGC